MSKTVRYTHVATRIAVDVCNVDMPGGKAESCEIFTQHISLASLVRSDLMQGSAAALLKGTIIPQEEVTGSSVAKIEAMRTVLANNPAQELAALRAAIISNYAPKDIADFEDFCNIIDLLICKSMAATVE